MLLARVLVCCLLLVFATWLSAAQSSQNKGSESDLQQGIRVLVEQVTASEIRLIVRRATLQQAFTEIVKKTGIAIHHPMLPEGLVTADCKGRVKPVLACLLGPNVDMVFRNVSATSKDQEPIQPAEVWLLQAPVISGLIRTDKDVDSAVIKQEQAVADEKDKVDNTEILLELAKDPMQRMEAIASLAIEGRKDDLNVRLMLREALADTNPGVRAQAVFALARREGEGAIEEVRQAMLDENADVRGMAVEYVGNDTALLQQALKDSDAGIRLYAATKLALLNKADQGN